jgi:HEAT repeat protein
VESAGRVGGDDAVPFLVAELKDPSIDVKQSAIRALYLTASRQAVPILIELLRSPEERISGTAEFGLQVLTHRTIGEQSGQATAHASTYAAWQHWWMLHTKTVEIFKDDQCAEPEPLT